MLNHLYYLLHIVNFIFIKQVYIRDTKYEIYRIIGVEYLLAVILYENVTVNNHKYIRKNT